MKKAVKIFIASIVLAFCIYRLFFILSPAVEIFNNTDKIVVTAKFYLPESRIVMDNILPNEKSKIHYDFKQSGGELKYELTFSDSTMIEGICGTIKNYDFAKRIRIKINKEHEIVCE